MARVQTRAHPLWGIGQLTMDPEREAALKACSDDCERQYGVASGAPNVFSLAACFTQCNLATPPTVDIPGVTPEGGYTPPPITPETIPTVIPGVPTPEPEPEPEPEPPPPAKADMTPWIIGGVVVVGAVAALAYYTKKKGRR